MKKKRNYKEEIRVLLILIIVAFTIKTSVAEIYVVPTPSMEDTIMVGDMLFGNKFIYGMKTPTWIGIPYTRTGFDIPWYRLPAFKKVEILDVVIFEYPRDPFQKYVKRCMGTAGDSVRIDQGNIYVNGDKMPFSETGNASKILIDSSAPQTFGNPLYAEFREVGNNQNNISTFQVPYKGMEINFNNVVSWEAMITLLVLDEADVEIKIQRENENEIFKFTSIDPEQISRTRGFLKYKIQSWFSNPKKVRNKQEKDAKEYVYESYEEYVDEKKLNPWYWQRYHPGFNEVLSQLYAADNSIIMDNIFVNGKPASELKSYEL